MRIYGAALPVGTISDLSPVAVAKGPYKSKIGSPDFITPAVKTGLVTSTVFLLGGPYGAGLMILWAPVGAGLGAVAGVFSHVGFQPCRKAIQQSVIDFDPENTAAAKLNQKLREQQIRTSEINEQDTAEAQPAGREIKSVIHVQPKRIALRECAHYAGTYCLDVVIRATLFDVRRKEYLYDVVLAQARGELPAHPEEKIAAGPYPRKLDDYCSEGGKDLLHRDFAEAFDALVNRVIEDVGLRAP
jgi:hypothetical protein